MTGADHPAGWWLIGNRYYGLHIAYGADRIAAKAEVRDRLSRSFEEQGYAPSRARLAASSYGVFVIAGGVTREEAAAAQAAWDRGDCTVAEALRERYRNALRRARHVAV